MAKKKTIGWDRVVEEQPDGALRWNVGNLWFVFRAGGLGVNMAVEVDGMRHPLLFAKDAKTAGLLAEGFATGLEAFSRLEALRANPA